MIPKDKKTGDPGNMLPDAGLNDFSPSCIAYVYLLSTDPAPGPFGGTLGSSMYGTAMDISG